MDLLPMGLYSYGLYINLLPMGLYSYGLYMDLLPMGLGDVKELTRRGLDYLAHTCV